MGNRQCIAARCRQVLGCTLLLGAVSTAGPVLARDYLDSRVTVNAYGTLGAAIGSDSDVEQFRTISRGGPPLTKDITVNYDTRLGLQIEGHLTGTLDVVWQGLLWRNLDDHTRVDTKWAYLRYRPREWLDLKLGRYLVPFYQISDQLYVGYAHPWARPPQEVYGITDEVDHADGLSARGYWALGGWNYMLEATWGQYEDERRGTTTTVEPRTASLTVSKGNLSARGMVANVPLKLEGAGIQAFNAFVQALPTRKRYDATGGQDIWYYNLGFQYEDAEWLFMGETVVTDLSDNHLISEYLTYSLTAGRRFGEWLPYLTYSRMAIRNDEPDPLLQGLINGRLYDQQTATAGVRWDFQPGYALKLQADTTRVDSGSRGFFTPAPRGNVRSYTLVLDWAW